MAALQTSTTPQQVREDRAICRAMCLLEKRLRKPGEVLSSCSAVRQYLALHFTGCDREVFSALWLDRRNCLIASERLFVGTLNQAAVYPREVARRCLQVNASAVIFAHNHPSGCAEPSISDLIMTCTLMDALALFDVRVLDHFIVAGSDAVSLYELDLLGKTDFSSKDVQAEPQKQELIQDKQDSGGLTLGFDVLSLRAQMRAAFTLLQTKDDYESNEALGDVGFALIDADKRLSDIYERIDAMRCA